MLSPSPGSESKRSKYYLLGLVGQGQFGQVYCAIHRQTGRLVALKNLEQERFPTHKFLRELRFLLSLQHPNIVTCQALEHTATGRYLVMDYCEGGTLRTLMTEGRRLSLSVSLQLVADVLAGLEHAHSRGIVHCDIKPENILLHVQPSGWQACISDFGIARLVREVIPQEGDTGSPAYMAPERFYGQYSAASDLYSVGVLLFELLAGHRPFSGTPAELMSAHLNLPLKQPDMIPSVWQPFIARALQKLPARRFHSAREMLSALKATVEQSASADTLHELTPLFWVAASFACPFKPLQQIQKTAPVTKLAACAVTSPTETAADFTETSFNTYHALGPALIGQHWPNGLLFVDPTNSPANLSSAAQPYSLSLSAPIEQIVVQQQSCLVATQRSVLHLPVSLDPLVQIEPIVEWSEDCIVAFEPQNRGFVALAADPEHRVYRFDVWRLMHQQWTQLQPFSLPQREFPSSLRLLVLDRRHVLLVAAQTAGAAVPQTMLQLISRRGDAFGDWILPLNLQQMVPMLEPYQFLAVDQQAGTLLVIGLKPYRIQRLGVEISPQFLAVAAWGFVIADAEGAVVFLDQEGRSLGKFQAPERLTAMTLVHPCGLLLATWNGQQATIWSFDIRTIGLDLIF